MRLYQTDDDVARVEVQLVDRLGRDLDGKTLSNVDIDELLPFDGRDVQDATRKRVADAEALGLLAAENDVVGADANEDSTAGRAVAQGNTEFLVFIADMRDALGRVVRDDLDGQDELPKLDGGQK